MPVKLAYSLLCDYVLKDNGKQSLIGIFSRMHVRVFPGSIAQYYYVSAFEYGGLADVDLSLDVVAVDRNWSKHIAEMKFSRVAESDGPVDDSTHVFATVPVVGIKFPEPGIYEFRLSEGGTLLGACRLTVVRREAKNANPTS